MEELTRSEEAIMRILWDIKEGVVHDIINKMSEPTPPYTTVSSVVRVLEKKGYVSHKAYGKTHVYFPTVSKKEYRKKSFTDFVKYYFEGSAKNVVSFMVKEKNLKANEVQELKQLIERLQNEKPS